MRRTIKYTGFLILILVVVFLGFACEENRQEQILDRVNNHERKETLVKTIATREQQSQILDRISAGEDVAIEEVDQIIPIECLRSLEGIPDTYYGIYATDIQGELKYGYILYEKKGDSLAAVSFYDPYYVSPAGELGWIELGKTTFEEIKQKYPEQELYYEEAEHAIVSEHWIDEGYFLVVYEGEETENMCIAKQILRQDGKNELLAFQEVDSEEFLGRTPCLEMSEIIPKSLYYLKDDQEDPVPHADNISFEELIDNEIKKEDIAFVTSAEYFKDYAKKAVGKNIREVDRELGIEFLRSNKGRYYSIYHMENGAYGYLLFKKEGNDFVVCECIDRNSIPIFSDLEPLEQGKTSVRALRKRVRNIEDYFDGPGGDIRNWGYYIYTLDGKNINLFFDADNLLYRIEENGQATPELYYGYLLEIDRK